MDAGTINQLVKWLMEHPEDREFAGCFLMFFWCLFAPLLYIYGGVSNGWHLFFGIVGTILFSGFIIYDTNNIMRYMGVDDYVIAAIELYLDVINLFLCILTIFGGGDSR